MPTKKSSRKRDENGKFVSKSKETTVSNAMNEIESFSVEEVAVVSRVGEYEEKPVPEKSGDVITRHGSTIHYS